MSNVVWKIQLPLAPCDIGVMLPEGARVLSCQTQYNQISVWFLVRQHAAEYTQRRRFVVVETGHAFSSLTPAFVGTVQDGDNIWHVFEVTQ